MTYKSITIIEKLQASGEIYEASMDKVMPFLDKGFTIVNSSSSHTINAGVSQSDTEFKPTSITLISTYLLMSQ